MLFEGYILSNSLIMISSFEIGTYAKYFRRQIKSQKLRLSNKKDLDFLTWLNSLA